MTAYLEGDDVGESEAHILMNQRGQAPEGETEGEAIEAIERTEESTNEQDAFLAQ